jgi:hypothetical protein
MLVASALLVGAACSGAKRAKPADTAVVDVDSPVPAPRADSSRAGAPAPGVTPAPTATAAPTPTVAPSETVLTGKLVAGGLAATPVTQLQVEGAKATTLVGSLEPELRRLGGATVWVTGSPVTGAPNVTFSVTRYEVVAIDGAKPAVGTLRTRDGATWLVTERDTVKLVSPPAGLGDRTGAKVWVVGRRSGPELTVQSYGIIRDP